ncbi:MAG: CHAT domain-containing tetratricopeptide repeat protein [Bacteroidia bacterium]
MNYLRTSGILLLCFMLFSVSFAQKTDTTGVWETVILAEKQMDSLNQQQALVLLDEAEAVYSNSADYEKIIKVYLKKVSIYLNYLDLPLAAEYLQNARITFSKNSSLPKSLEAEWLFLKGVYLYETAAYDSALYYLRLCEPMYREVRGPESKYTGECYYFLAAVFLRKSEYEHSLDYSNRALDLFLKAKGDSSWLGKTYNLIGFTYGEQGYLNKQIDYYQKSLAVNLALYGEDNYEVAVNYNNLAYTEGVKGNFHNAIAFLHKCLKINEKKPKDNQQLLGSNYLNLGMDYAYIGDYGRADYYMAKALEVRTRIYGENHPDIANVYHNMGSVAMDLAEYEKAKNYFLKALEIRTRYLGEGNPYVALSHTMLGRSLLYLKQKELARDHLERGLAGLRAVLGERHFMVANSYFDLGLCLEEMGEMTAAIENYEKAIAVVKNTAGKDNAMLTRLYDAYATALVNAGRIDDALIVLQDGLIVVSEGFSDKDFLKNPALSQMDFDITGIFILGQKAGTLLKTDVGNSAEGLRSIWETYLLADSLIQKLRLGFFNEKSGELLSFRFVTVYENAISVAWKIAEITGDDAILQKAFSLTEKAKSMLLFQAVRENQAMITAGIPPDLLGKERYLRAEIGFCEKVIFDERRLGENVDSLKLFDAINRHFTLTQERQALILEFEKTYPEYYRLKFDDQVATVGDVQKRLDENESVLTFFTGEHHLYSFLLTKKGFYPHRSVTGEQWLEDMGEFITYLKDTEIADQKAYTSENYQRFIRPAYRFYQDLIQPFEDELQHSEDLVLIPDGVLGYLPFDILLTQPAGGKADYGSLPYMLRSWQMRYAYSATLFCAPEPVTRKNRALFAGFAPGAETTPATGGDIIADIQRSHPRFSKLYANQPEVKKAAGLMAGKSWLASLATETAFRANAGGYKILHLATHAWVNDLNPLYSGLWFVSELEGDSAHRDSLALYNEAKDGILYAYEIYNMDIPADLVVLSACETGAGSLRRGEGIMSLARAFRYAGSPNVLMTLWKAEDVATQGLMEKFYQNLRKGMEKDEALRSAKLDFLSETDRQHPHFWAGFVLIGDELPVRADRPLWIWILVGGAIALVFYLLNRRKKLLSPSA